MADTEAFRITYLSATHMLELVAQPTLSPLLSFAHDSVHAMTAYAAGFLIKVCCISSLQRLHNYGLAETHGA